MIEIKFTCPHCSQHIACDDTCCGERIDCPGCGREIIIPQRAAFIPAIAGKMTLTPPVALKETRYPRSATLDPWTEEQWKEHASKFRSHQPLSLLPIWILLLLPYFLAFILLSHQIGFVPIKFCFMGCALLSGFYYAKIKHYSGAPLIGMGLLYSFAMLMTYIILAVGLLFVGCIFLVIGK